MAERFLIDRKSSEPEGIHDPNGTEVAAVPRAADISVPPAIEARLIAILDAPRGAGEMLSDAFRTKERALGEAFTLLSGAEALALHRRLTNPQPDDALARRFARLVIERRQRLLGFLTEVRRRAATLRPTVAGA